MKALRYLAGIFLIAQAALLIPLSASASWIMIAEDQHSAKAGCPKGFVLVSVESGDADLLVCTPRSRIRYRRKPEQAKYPSDEEGPLEGPKFN